MRKAIRLFRLTRNDKRYPPSKRQLMENPQSILVSGTLKQAEHLADLLSLNEAGCDNYYLVDIPMQEIIRNEFGNDGIFARNIFPATPTVLECRNK